MVYSFRLLQLSFHSLYEVRNLISISYIANLSHLFGRTLVYKYIHLHAQEVRIDEFYPKLTFRNVYNICMYLHM